jgi:hypothetical protein
MKKLRLLVVLSAVVGFGFVNSCAKEKVPVITTTPDCADSIHFSTQIGPMIQSNCISCHDVGGSAPTLTNYVEISTNATAILSTLNGTPQLMPQGGPALNDTLIQQFTCWISQGKPNN